MNSRDYWQKREEEALKHYLKDEAAYEKEIKAIYQRMLDSCQEQIDSFYGQYANREGISIAEAKKRVSSLNVKRYERKAKRYVREKNFSKHANDGLRLYNATMKINRLEMLKANIGLELISGHDELEKYMEGILQGRTMEELQRQAGILGKTVRNNAKTAHAIVNGSFQVAKVGDQSTFSDRIWQYQDLMREDLGKILQTALIQGKNPRAVAKDLKKYWYGADPRTGGGATYCMERLMRTELARVQTEAQKQSFERNEFDDYMFISNEHGNTCKICNSLDGKHFKVKDMMPGLNAPPMHPNCRCSTVAWVDDEEYEAWLDYLDKGGTTEEWNKVKEINDISAVIAEKTKWLKAHNYDMYGDTVEEMEAGFWEEAEDGSMPGNATFINNLNEKIDRIYQKMGYKNIVNDGRKRYNKAIQGTHTIEQDLKATNPNYDINSITWGQNCQKCVPTYEMRRRGFDVTALPRKVRKDDVASQWRNIFKNAKWIKCGTPDKASTKDNVVSIMTGFGDGARAEVYVVWEGGRASHVFVAENISGNIRFVDPQSNVVDVENYFDLIKSSQTELCRIDNLDTTEWITGCCK